MNQAYRPSAAVRGPGKSDAIIEILSRAPGVPILTIENVEHIVPLARALVGGGLPVLEVTLRTARALDAVRSILDQVPGAEVGVGTVTQPDQLEAAKAAGATFAVSPGSDPEVMAAADDLGMPFLPAIATPSELMMGLRRGYTCFKFFPAEAAGGVRMLEALSGPFPQALFCATGGITPEMFPAYLGLPNVLAVGASWLASDDAVELSVWEHVRPAQAPVGGRASGVRPC